MASASDNGGWPPGGDSPEGLPGLPEEWGVIVIPDDLSELSDEVEAIRAELNPAPPPTGWRRLAHRPAVRRLRRAGRLLTRAPALIISMAVLVTVASLFASAWPGPARQPATQRTAASAGTDSDRDPALPAMDLIGPDGQTVPLRGRLPLVVLLVDGCDCAGLISDTVTAVRPDVTVAAVSAKPHSTATAKLPPAGTPQAEGKTLRYLQDPTDGLRRQMRLAEPAGAAAALLVDRSGTVVRTVPQADSVEDLRADLARL